MTASTTRDGTAYARRTRPDDRADAWRELRELGDGGLHGRGRLGP